MGKILLNWTIGIIVGVIVLSIFFPDTFGQTVGDWLNERAGAAANDPAIVQLIAVGLAILVGIGIFKGKKSGGGDKKPH